MFYRYLLLVEKGKRMILKIKKTKKKKFGGGGAKRGGRRGAKNMRDC